MYAEKAASERDPLAVESLRATRWARLEAEWRNGGGTPGKSRGLRAEGKGARGEEVPQMADRGWDGDTMVTWTNPPSWDLSGQSESSKDG